MIVGVAVGAFVALAAVALLLYFFVLRPRRAAHFGCLRAPYDSNSEFALSQTSISEFDSSLLSSPLPHEHKQHMWSPLVPISVVAEMNRAPAPAQPSADAPPKYRALYRFLPSFFDELALEAGDKLVLLGPAVADNGWFHGRNVRTNKTGLFPSNYV